MPHECNDIKSEKLKIEKRVGQNGTGEEGKG